MRSALHYDSVLYAKLWKYDEGKTGKKYRDVSFPQQTTAHGKDRLRSKKSKHSGRQPPGDSFVLCK